MDTISQTKPMLPDHWIGIRAAWQLLPGNPVEHLVSVQPKHLATHALVIGSTGSGKTNLLHHLIAQDMSRGHSICVLDLRGDLVNAVIEIAAGRIDPSLVRIIDLREKQRAMGFNPLYGKGEPYFRALSVLDVLEAEAESWGVQLAESLRNGLLLLAEIGQPLTKLEWLFYRDDFRARCLQAASSETAIGYWRRYSQLSPDRQTALAMPVLNKVSQLLATETLRRILGHREPIDLAAHLDQPGSVLLVSLAADELHASGRMMGSLILSSLCREIFARVDQAESHRNPVRLYVDEFEHFGLKDFETILAEGRRFKLSCVLSHQTLAQLTPRLRSMILGNVGMKFVFRSGREDSATLGKDLFGDPKAYDLTDLPVGYAMMWQRELGAIEVEVNEPIVRSGGALQRHGLQFLEQVYTAHGSAPPTIIQLVPPRVRVLPAPAAPEVTDPAPGPRISPEGTARTPVKPKSKSTLPPASLEDWLCN